MSLGEEQDRVRAGNRQPIRITDASAGLPTRSDPPRSLTMPAISAPAAMKRVEAAKSGGIVSPAYAMPRYVDPHST